MHGHLRIVSLILSLHLSPFPLCSVVLLPDLPDTFLRCPPQEQVHVL